MPDAETLGYDPCGGLPPEDDYCALDQPAGATLYGENHAFWFFDAQNQAHAYNHVDAFQHFYELRTERNWLIFPDGRVLYNWTEAAHTSRRKAGGGCLTFTCIEPFRRWTIDYLGTMRISSADEMAQGPAQEGPRAVVEYHCDVVTAAEPWKQGEGYAFGDTRYEQLFRMTGRLKTSQGDDLRLSGAGVRTHRRGRRALEPRNWFGHGWQTALFPSGRGFGLKRFPGQDGPEGRAHPAWSEAYVLDRGRVVPAEVIESAWLDDFTPSGGTVRVRLRSALGEADIAGEVLGTSWRTMSIGRAAENLREFGVRGRPGEYVMAQGAARWTWDGESVIGHIERSALGSSLRR